MSAETPTSDPLPSSNEKSSTYQMLSYLNHEYFDPSEPPMNQQTKSAMSLNVLSIGFVFVVPILVHWFLATGPLFMADSAANAGAQKASWATLMAACVAMLLGILFGALHAKLKAARQSIEIGKVVGRLFQEPGLYRAFLASPIVFGGVYTATLHALDPVLALIFAFQNGFFCEAIVRKHSP
jgi:hypothetical protein